VGYSKLRTVVSSIYTCSHTLDGMQRMDCRMAVTAYIPTQDQKRRSKLLESHDPDGVVNVTTELHDESCSESLSPPFVNMRCEGGLEQAMTSATCL